jgi:integrase
MTKLGLDPGTWTIPPSVTRVREGAWRASLRVRSPDGLVVHQIKRTSRTKSSAVNAVEVAAREWLTDYRSPQQRHLALIPVEPEPTMRELLARWRDEILPAERDRLALHDRTRLTYGYLINTLLGEEPPLQRARRERAELRAVELALASGRPARLPRPPKASTLGSAGESFLRLADKKPSEVTDEDIRVLIIETTQRHGNGSGRHVRSILGHVFDLAKDNRWIRINPLDGIRSKPRRPVVPARLVRRPTIDSTFAPDDDDLARLLAALHADPLAGPMTEPRKKVGNGKADPSRVSNPRDIADLLHFLYATGARLGEALQVRWEDIDWTPERETVAIGGTLVHIPGRGMTRQAFTKTDPMTGDLTDFAPRIVPLEPSIAAALKARAEVFGIRLGRGVMQKDRAVFPSPQQVKGRHHPRWRDSSNCQKAIRWAYDTHGAGTFDRAGSHTGRRWRATSWLAAGVPLATAAAWLGHDDLTTTQRYGKVTAHSVAQGWRLSALPVIEMQTGE